MPKYSAEHESLFPFITYKDATLTYEWLLLCLVNVFSDKETLKIKTRISFTANHIEYECSSFEEFREAAFNQEIEMNHLSIFADDDSTRYSDSLAHLLISHLYTLIGKKKGTVSISTRDSKYILALKDALDQDLNELLLNIKKYKNNESDSRFHNLELEITRLLNQGASSQNGSAKPRKRIFSRIFWKFIIPIIVLVVGALLVWKLGIGQ